MILLSKLQIGLHLSLKAVSVSKALLHKEIQN